MKKKSFVFLGILIVLLIAAIAIFAYIMKKTRDVELVSYNGYESNVIITLENAAASKSRGMDNMMRRKFTPRNINIFEKCIKGKDFYLYSIEEDGSRSQNETGRYLLYKDYHYFLVERCDYTEVDGTPSTLYYYTELQVNVWNPEDKGDDVDKMVYLPIMIEKGAIASDVPVFFKWSDTVGLSNFEDLKEYYSRLDDKTYSIDEENKCITLNSADEGNLGVADLYATDEGITLVIGNNINFSQDSQTVTYINGELVGGDSTETEYED